MRKRHVKAKTLPVVSYSAALGAFFGVLVFGTKALELHPFVAVTAAWLSSIVFGLSLAFLLVKIKPDLRFSTDQEIDGFGYVHQPVGVVVYMTLIAVASFVIFVIKR